MSDAYWPTGQECHCDCHEENSAVMHFAPCCDGQCDICLRYFVGLKKHKESHKYKGATDGPGTISTSDS